MKIYLSGTYTDQARLRAHASTLHDMGHEITSSWVREVLQPKHLSQAEWYHGLAVKDLAEVSAADCIILDLDGTSTSGGRYVELGFAIGRYSMLKYVVGGDQSGVFLTLADAKFPDWDSLFSALGTMQ